MATSIIEASNILLLMHFFNRPFPHTNLVSAVPFGIEQRDICTKQQFREFEGAVIGT
jgi:hypothetical protein